MPSTRIAIASPTSAPSTATGRVTSCPPLIAGVIIGPQQPGAVLATMWPPSRTGPSISEPGPMIPSPNRSTKMVSAARTPVSTAMTSSSLALDRTADATTGAARREGRRKASGAEVHRVSLEQRERGVLHDAQVVRGDVRRGPLRDVERPPRARLVLGGEVGERERLAHPPGELGHDLGHDALEPLVAAPRQL